MEKTEGEIVSNYFIAQRKFANYGLKLVDGGGGFFVYNMSDWNDCQQADAAKPDSTRPDPIKLSGKPYRYFETLDNLASYLEGFIDGKIGVVKFDDLPESEDEDGNEKEKQA